MASDMSVALQSPRRMLPRIKRVWQSMWHAASIYLPVVLMGVLALGTWWLAQNTPAFSPPAQNKPVKHEADYFMRNFAVKNFDAQGQLSSEVAGEKGRHFGDTDVLEIDNARVRSWKQGRLSVATANKAYSNGDGSEVQLVGNAKVVREASKDALGQPLARLQFEGEFLHAFANEERLTSNKPITLKRGADTFAADSMAYDNLSRVADLTGRVKVQMQPPTTPSTPATLSPAATPTATPAPTR